MEKLKRVLTQIAYNNYSAPFHYTPLLPILSFASKLYGFALFLRHHLYAFGLFKSKRLPVPVISVGNLTWGGNGKTPMVEFLSLLFSRSGICPLILTRGYAGGDEAKMLKRHLAGTSAKIGIGANRAATAACFLNKYGYTDHGGPLFSDKMYPIQEFGSCYNSLKIGVVILDDAMQHWSLSRDVEIVMVNGIMLWGNCHLLPRGPLREPVAALERADIVVIHHADLVSYAQLRSIKSRIIEVKDTINIFFSRLVPCYFFEAKNHSSTLPLKLAANTIVLCVSAIGCAEAFVRTIKKLGALHVDIMDFSDHHIFKEKDINMIKRRLRKLENRFEVKPIVVFTEKVCC
ncbi:probable tetraacyldisaccharide 4'-kinase, mitochondrial isoform X2 [Amborella trichopoda]|uniref:probable tetraacyldisaccharide 4'-kinase, mitochondrial isoform X2 n=1 Tax=Amborella trichopoda TaxID=13333 RepID=UPI0009BD80B9|nr:probable tetraacyldisaccharide 4'-kinase, mitochondrial isoform X2 [Amborella trichopoda]|eukprot:XP_020530118.1 probable tetraacyldisaccharide 4'-kinase, mitochondrial isoform X2 [Amborella trichopoda]